ncbi:hypothetical protein Nepgr_031109 [Nepenthes gracilis]|uniref:Uncharacterized protein n=1 Tax=Nepenthes gracilis TaxID=150966 RepID=A0AAD3Y787_NEPGR|nr:hypothetical protein Nepgr_031109 [Nepenthes gracilis]
MEVSMELEDDLFFADLKKQISLLMDDDEDDPPAHYPSVCLQTYPQSFHHPNIQSPFYYQQNCTRGSKGTGVFIPRTWQPRRKTKQGQHAPYASKSNKQLVSSQWVSQSVSYSNSGSYHTQINKHYR